MNVEQAVAEVKRIIDAGFMGTIIITRKGDECTVLRSMEGEKK